MTVGHDARRRPRRLVALCALISSVAILAACSNEIDDGAVEAPATTGKAATDEPVRHGGKLVVGVESPIATLDPMKAGNTTDGPIRWSIYESFQAWSEEGKLVPNLAEEITHSDDFKVWTVRLREGATFSDGTPVDAEAIKANWLYRQDPANCTCSVDFEDDVPEVVDEHTIRFVRTEPSVRWGSFTGPEIMAPAMLVPGYDREHKPIGSGPFVLESRDTMTLRARDDYWRRDEEGQPLPRVEELQFVAIAEPSVRLSSLLNGEIDATALVDGTTIQAAEANPELNVIRAKAGTILAILNADTMSHKLRKAVSLALDRDALAQSQPGVRRQPAYGFATPPYMKYSFPRYDPKEARKIVEEITKEEGAAPKVEILCPNLAESSAILPVVVNQLNDVGIQASMTQLDIGAFAARVLGGGDFQAACFRVATFEVEPSGLSASLHSEGVTNIANLNDPEIDAAFDEDLRTADPQQRQELFKKIAKRASEQLTYVPLLDDVSAFVLGPRARYSGVLLPDHGPEPDFSRLWVVED